MRRVSQTDSPKQRAQEQNSQGESVRHTGPRSPGSPGPRVRRAGRPFPGRISDNRELSLSCIQRVQRLETSSTRPARGRL